MNKKLYKTIFNRNTGLIVVIAENKMAVFRVSGSLNNISYTQNKRKDELKAKLERNEISQADYDEQVKRIDRQNLVVNVVAGGLMAPSDSVLGIATSTVSPAVSYEIGQYFKQEGKEGSFEHIATHAVLGALTSAANGGNALSGAVSAGGAEAIAPIVAKVLYGKDNSQNLSADEKETVVAITTAIGTLSGSIVGDSSANAYIGNTVAGNAVENNYLFPPEQEEMQNKLARARAIYAKYQWDLEDEENPVLISEPTDAEKAELVQIEKELKDLADLSKSRDLTFKYYEDACLRTASRSSCQTYHHLQVVQRKEWTDKGIAEYKKDLDPVTGKPNSNWIEQPDYANKLHNYNATGTEIMDKVDGKYPNTKYVHKNGQYEVVVDSNGKVIEDDTNAGTFNYYSPSTNPIKFSLHKRFDMDGYFVFGNGGTDKTTFEVRDTWYSNNHLYTSPFSYVPDEQREKAIKMFNQINNEWLRSKK